MFFEPIIHLSHPLLPSIKPVYESTFPLCERREWSKLIVLLDEPVMCLEAILDEDGFIGFLISWRLRDCTFLEHFAIQPEQRGKQYGQKVLKHLIVKASNKLILETDLPLDEVAIRRIKFYERDGLAVIPFPYCQPPYRKGEQTIPMRLMSTIKNLDTSDFKQLANTIRLQVYERFY